MAISEEQRRERMNYLGASDAPKIFTDAYDLWAEKTGKVSSPDLSENKAVEAGTFLERSILDWAESKIGYHLTRNQSLLHSDGIRSANLDASFSNGFGDLALVEAKSSGILSGIVDDDQWGEEETDQVPERVLIQTHHQMDVASDVLGTKVMVAYVPAILVFRGFVMFHVPYDPELGEQIQEAEYRFWNDFVKRDIPPDESLPSLEVISRRSRVQGKIVPLEYALVQDWQAANERRKEAQKLEDAAKTAMLAALDDGEIGEVRADDGTVIGILEYRESRRKAYYVEEKTYRTPRWKENKKR